MNSLEFTTKIEHGIIHLPKELEEYDNAVAHVVLTVETPDDKLAKKERLFAALKEMQQADIFRNIEDPVEWQRKLRDEWE
ncbi:MAG: hypothetical protein M3449_04185 [Acidobacteriota bacterium]|nr:hypothetical protein [Acidobacteriota bacterium]MDQ3490251.1 hypothetical protein [Acidobacteriota bacterium]